MMRIDPTSTTVAELLDRDPAAMRLFIDRRMSCIGCAIAPYHTIEEACREYDLAVDGFMRELAALGDRPKRAAATPRRPSPARADCKPRDVVGRHR